MAPLTALLISAAGLARRLDGAGGDHARAAVALRAARRALAGGHRPAAGQRPCPAPRTARRSAATERSYRLSELIGTSALLVPAADHADRQRTRCRRTPWSCCPTSRRSASRPASPRPRCPSTASSRSACASPGACSPTASACAARSSSRPWLTAIGALILLQVAGVESVYIAMAYQGMTLSGFPPLQILLWPEFFGRDAHRQHRRHDPVLRDPRRRHRVR